MTKTVGVVILGRGVLLVPRTALFCICATLQAWQLSPAIEITTQSLPRLLPELRVKGSRQSYVIKQPVILTGTTEQWSVNNLAFEPGGTLYIGSTNLQIDVTGVILPPPGSKTIFASFLKHEADSGSKGPDGPGAGGRGGDGTNGEDGHSSGTLTLQLRKLPARPFRVALNGQSDGRGGDGGKGSPGSNWTEGKSRSIRCIRLQPWGDNGSPGMPGGDGGNPGLGGSCGAGGALIVISCLLTPVSCPKLCPLSLPFPAIIS